MAEQRYCKKCSAMIYMLYGVTKCPYCGCTDLVENFGETDSQKVDVDISISPTNERPRKERLNFDDEERLALGLYPEDEGYKMSLISKILGKK